MSAVNLVIRPARRTKRGKDIFVFLHTGQQCVIQLEAQCTNLYMIGSLGLIGTGRQGEGLWEVAGCGRLAVGMH